MGLFRQSWSPDEAEEWTVHDLWASILSVACYILTAIGVAGSLLVQVWGFIALAGGICAAVLMFFIIDGKLRVMSEHFEKKQQQYLDHVDKTTRWEEQS